MSNGRIKSPWHASNQGDAEPEQRLWLAVIIRALLDATWMEGAVPPSYWRSVKELDRQMARDWFETGSQDFRDVCGYANLPASSVQAAAIELFDNITNDMRSALELALGSFTGR